MVETNRHPAIGYLLPAPGRDAPPPDLARCCDLLAERAPVVEPDPPAGAWFALRAGKRASSPTADGADLLADLDRHGFSGARLAFGPTPGVARLAALVAASPLTILASNGVPTFLAPLSVEVLGLADDVADRLRLVGLHTLGAIAELPRGELGTYLGFLAKEVEALARGEDDRPLRPRRLPLVLRIRRDLEWPLTDRAALAALLGRLVAPPLGQLARRGLGVTRATLRLTVGAETRHAVALLPAPTVDTQVVLGALLAAADNALGPMCSGEENWDGGASEDTDATGISAVALALIAPRPLPVKQASFFDVPQGRLACLHSGLAEARRRGDGVVGYLRPVDPAHPRPERRYALDPEALPRGEAAT